MKLLITGGCGFLGSNLASDALARGDELMVFDNLYRNGSRDNLAWLQAQGMFAFEHGDIRRCLRIFGHCFVVQRPPPHRILAEPGVAGGYAEHVLEVVQQPGRRLRVLGIAEIVRHADAQ